jgi:methionyl-tRNA synthetase
VTGRLMVIAPGPTANGDLHLGHLAGPFLAADICTRYARATGRDALYGTGMHFTQNYIVATARRLGLPPGELSTRSAGQVAATLDALGIHTDGFIGELSDTYTKTVLTFVERLHAAGALRLRTVDFPYAPARGEYLTDAYVRGGCPVCLADGAAGLCESCGHPIASGALVEPRSTVDPGERVVLRPVEVLVFPTEEHRAGLEAYVARTRHLMRPHLAQAVEEYLSRPLPDYPVTMPISWGIPAPFAEVAGQVVYSEAETVAWSMHASALAARARGAVLGAEDELWFPEADTEVVYFLGFDATYPFAIGAVAMLLALGDRYALPAQFVSNEFYELDNDKFSTSRGHAVWGRELAAEVPRDLIRFHLASTGPEYQRTGFTRAALDQVTADRLVGPWNQIASTVDGWVGRGPLPVSARSRTAAGHILSRFAGAYGVRRFSMTLAAFTLSEQLARLARWTPTAADAGDYCHQVDVVLRCAAPILVDLAARALPDVAIPARSDVTAITPPALPRLHGGPA